MSRSVRKAPVHSNAIAQSEKEDKKIWHQRYRHLDKQRLAQAGDLEAYVPTDEREVSDPYLMSKDGKRYMSPSKELEVAKRQAAQYDDAKGVDRQMHKLRAK